jgi:predicted glycoside hydrolase/deacetylase ChbG (UPF0249 family)
LTTDRKRTLVKNLIVNADDFAWTVGVTRGISEAHQKGLVTSTSLLANGAAFDCSVALAKHSPTLGIGVHLNLTNGPPSAPKGRVKNLVNAAGNLEGSPESLLLRLASGTISLAEIELEWHAQIQKIRDAGVQPTHLDGHKHVQMLPGLFEIALRLAKRHAIPAIRVSHEASPLRTALSAGADQKTSVVMKQGVQARGLKFLARDAREMAERAGIATADYFCGIAQTGELTREGITRLIKALPEGTTELMCHPGYADDELAATSTRLQTSRRTELEILTDTTIRNLVAAQGIRLINYGMLANEA